MSYLFRCVFLPEVLFRDKIEGISQYYNIVQISISSDGIYLLTTHCNDSMLYYKIPMELCKTTFISHEYENKIIHVQINVKELWSEYKNCKRKTNLLFGLAMKNEDLNHFYVDYIHTVTNELLPESTTIKANFNIQLESCNLFNQGNLPDKSTCHKISIPMEYLKQKLPTLVLFSTQIDWCFINNANPSLFLIANEPNSNGNQGFCKLDIYHQPKYNILIESNPENNNDCRENTNGNSVVHQRFFSYDFGLLFKTKLMYSAGNANVEFYTKPNSPLLIVSENPNKEQVMYYLNSVI